MYVQKKSAGGIKYHIKSAAANNANADQIKIAISLLAAFFGSFQLGSFCLFLILLRPKILVLQLDLYI